MDRDVVRCRERGELGEVTGEPEVTGSGERDGAFGEPRGAAGELSDLSRERTPRVRA